MKWSQTYLTAVFICDLLVTPERSHSPSISCGHREAEQLSLSKSLRLVLPGALASRGWDHQTTTNLTEQSDSWLHRPIATSIRKSVYGLESCRHNGNIVVVLLHFLLMPRWMFSLCSPSFFFSQPACLSRHLKGVRHAHHKQLVKTMKWPFSARVLLKNDPYHSGFHREKPM